MIPEEKQRQILRNLVPAWTCKIMNDIDGAVPCDMAYILGDLIRSKS